MTADDFEDRLRDALRSGATAADADAGGEATGDRRALVVRADRRRRRQRQVGAAAAGLVVAGAVTAGWSVAGDDRVPTEQVAVETTDEAAATDGPGEEVIVSDDPLPVVERPEEDPFLALPRPFWPTRSGSLFVRTLADGTIVGVRANTYADPGAENQAPPQSDVPPWWEEPAWCVTAGDVVVEAIAPEATGRLTGTRRAGVPPGQVLASASLFGVPAREPTWIAVVQAGADAAVVRATFPGGETDEMTPVEGLAVLVAPAARGVDLDALDGVDDEVTLTALDAEGAEVGRAEVDWVAYEERGTVEPDECTPPTELPAPGEEQPADPAAAEAGVRATWDAAFGQPARTPTGDLFDDPTGLDQAEAAFRARQGDEVLAGVTVPIDGVVFADAETAYVTYTVHVPALDLAYDDRFAVLVLEDGTWKVTRDSVCALLSIGGGPVCPPL